MRKKWLVLVPLAVVLATITPVASAQAPVIGAPFRDCPDCPEMVVVPRGSFRMGLPSSLRTEKLDVESPPHEVAIGYEFSVARYEVTVGQFSTFVKESGFLEEKSGCSVLSRDMQWKVDTEKNWQNPGFQQRTDHPVVCVNWIDAKAYVEWLSKRTGKNYRLLSESEWEYVARAGSRGLRPWGEAESDACKHGNVWDETSLIAMGLTRTSDRSMTTPSVSVGTLGIREGGSGGSTMRASLGPWYRSSHWCSDEHAYTAPVGKYQPNRFGISDMIGNVWEWVEDCMNASYIDAPSDGSAWRTGDCNRRIQRGASWASVPQDARVARRAFRDGAFRSFDSGFRVAASP